VSQPGEADISSCLFLPHLKKSDETSAPYSLCYAPQNVYMFIKFFYGIYERVLKAKDLIYEKLLQDLAEMSLAQKQKAGICDGQTGAFVSSQLDLFFKERYEFLLKGIFATTTMQNSQGLMHTGSVSGGNLLIDHSKYEDFARVLLGKNAFLLFQIDKIIAQAIKQLLQMHSDHAS